MTGEERVGGPMELGTGGAATPMELEGLGTIGAATPIELWVTGSGRISDGLRGEGLKKKRG